MKKAQTQQKLIERLESRRISQVQAAREIGISNGTISNIVAGKFDNISDGMWNRIAAWLGMDNWVMIETENFKRIKELCFEAQESSRMFGISALSGYSKTSVLKNYVQKNPYSFYVLGHTLMNGKKNFLIAIQNALGLTPNGGGAWDILNNIVDYLLSLDKPLLIIDDCSKIGEGNIRVIQLLYDMTEGRVGFILSGTDHLKWFLERGTTKNKMGFSEMYRRIEYWLPLVAPSKKEITEICKANGVVNSEAINFICNSSRNYGTVRAMVNNALRLQARNGKIALEQLVKETEGVEAELI